MFTRHPNATAVPVYYVLAEKEPQADSAGVVFGYVAGPVESIEDERLIRFRDANSMICDGEQHSFSLCTQCDIDAALGWGIFDGVTYQVADYVL